MTLFVKMAKYYVVPLLTAFEKKVDVKPLSALFTACFKNGTLLQNPVANATKPRIGEMDIFVKIPS